MFSTQINIPASDRAQLADLLNQQLADLTDLESQTKQAHWNVRGRHFYQFHKLFEELAAAVDEHIDDLAERITALGGFAMGTVRQSAQASRLDDFPLDQGDDHGYVDVLSGRFAICANQIRTAVIMAEELSDSTTADLLTAISRSLDKSLWFLEAHMRPVHGNGDPVEATRPQEVASRQGEPELDGDSSAQSPQPPATRSRAKTPKRTASAKRRS